MNEKSIEKIYKLLDSVLSLVRILLFSKFKKTLKINKQNNTCVILGNGPSLTNSLSNNKDSISKCDLVAVNFMGMTQDFVKYKPIAYVCVDPAFWYDVKNDETKDKVFNLYKKLAEIVSWKVQLYLPYEASKVNSIADILGVNKNIELRYFNKTKFNGVKKLSHFFYSKQLGMPRPQNILVAALMLAIHSDYKEIYLAGADNDWVRNLWVDENNNVRLDDFHFYDKSEKQPARIMDFSIYEILVAFSHTFKSYQDIASYVKCRRDISIFNLNKYSFIDSFEKKDLIE